MNFPLLYDPSIIILIPALLLAFWAQQNVKGSFEKFKRVPNSKRITGAEVAREILDRNSLQKISITRGTSYLCDHYNPATKTICLSPEVYTGTSISALSISAHETGHALQHAEGYNALIARAKLFPVVNISSQASMPLFFIGLLTSIPSLMYLGIILFSATLLFQIITLPVEFNASSRALNQIRGYYTDNSQEIAHCQKMLKAAALTYVAAALMSLANLLRLLMRARSR